jgi:phosphatidylethanolamine/phosphatidyl-N-methylethanolamine N-methyltransferase
MFKNSYFNKLCKNYNLHLYSGILGYLMKSCHKNLEKFVPNVKISKILEIGSGTHPHRDFIKHNYKEYHIAETSNFAINFLKKKKFIVKKYNGKNLPYKNKNFDRIIISHCLEHINNPEDFLKEVMRKLKKGGILSISLPTDPGLLWRLGRYFVYIFINKKTYKMKNDDFYYINAIEHVNSIFNLIEIIRFNFKGKLKDNFWPLPIKHPDINLFYNVHIFKK